MAKKDYWDKFALKRNSIKKDIVYFMIPGFIFFVLGIASSARDGWDKNLFSLIGLLLQPQELLLLSTENIIGVALVSVGLLILFVAAGTLRMNYSSSLVIRKNHKLVTHGIYRFVRHPVYFGAGLICAGIPIYASSTLGFVLMAVLGLIVLNRIKMEEALLIEEFGEKYKKYQKRTKKIIPFIY